MEEVGDGGRSCFILAFFKFLISFERQNMRLGRKVRGAGKSWGKEKHDQNIVMKNSKLKGNIQLNILEQEVTSCQE